MPISYKDFMKHAAKVTKNEAIRERDILRGIKHFDDGSAVVTDSHRLYLVRNIHDRTDNVVLSPAGKVIEGNYPDVKRIIPDSSNHKQVVTVNVADLLTASDTIKFLAPNDKPAILRWKENEVNFQTGDVGYNYQLDTDLKYNISLNAEYVVDTMKLFKDAGCTEVTMRFFGGMRPVVFEYENVLALILPVREPGGK